MNEPRPLGELLRSLISRLGGGDPDIWNAVRSHWETISGPPWSLHTKPVSLHDRILVVEAVSPAASSLLKYGKASLLKGLQARFGEEAIVDVRIRVGGAERAR